MRTVKNVRNPVMARLKGTSGNSKGERFFDLLSDRPWVRIPPGSPKLAIYCSEFLLFILHIVFSNKLAVDVKVEHAAVVCNANSQLTPCCLPPFRRKVNWNPKKMDRKSPAPAYRKPPLSKTSNEKVLLRKQIYGPCNFFRLLAICFLIQAWYG